LVLRCVLMKPDVAVKSRKSLYELGNVYPGKGFMLTWVYIE